MQTETRPPTSAAPDRRPPARRPFGRAMSRPLRAIGRTRARWWEEDANRPAWQGRLWTVLLIVLLGGFAFKVGATDWYTSYPAQLPDGRTIQLPNGYASIDHPFHTAKERATVDALRAGWLPQWFSNHQGGFPAEFYPNGGDLIVALAYLLAFGLIPLAVVHELVVIGVLCIPPLAYWAIARRERLPLSVAVLAAVIHLFVRGNWLAGGSRELIDFGLWPDTLASYLPLFLILWGADWLRRGDRRGLLLATAVATFAVYTNPRSILGLVAAGLALGVVALSELVRLRPLVGAVGGGRWAVGGGRWERRRRPTPTLPPSHSPTPSPPTAHRPPPTALVLLAGRALLLAALVGMLSAALILPLRENQDRYTFTIYFRFESARQVWTNPDTANGIGYIESVLPQLIALAGLGIVVALLRRGFYTRVFALLLPLSYLIVTLAGWTWRDLPVFAQLEGPRLMPLLRPATIFLAALGAHEGLRLAVRLFRLRGGTMLAGAASVIVAALLMLEPQVPLDRGQRGLPLNETTDRPAFAAIARAAYIFEEEAGPNDKPLVLGNNMISWHDSFWVPALTGRDVYHNDWLWFWRTVDYGYQELLQDERGALDAAFLARHGLTMVLIATNRADLIELANSHDYLRLLDPGVSEGYAIYRVESPPGPPNGYIIPENGEVTALEVHPERLTARVNSAQAGTVRVIINEFPRWRAWVNGAPVAIGRTEEGYISLAVPQGEATIELRYITSRANWIGRALVALGTVLLIGIVAGPSLRRRLRRG